VASQRLFFALVPDEATRERIVGVAAALRLEAGSRLVPRNNLHMTLAFVGEVPSPQVPALLQVGGEQRMDPFRLRFADTEYWPKPEVVVAAARTFPDAVLGFWQRLHRDLASHQWALAPKRFRPHVTLARKVPQAPVFQAMSSFDWTAREFSLMRSDTSGSEPAYTVVATWPLLDDGEIT